MPDVVEVITPSRLHFGMFSFGQPSVRQFGGVGAMINRPGVRLQVVADRVLSATGPASDRALAFARRVAEAWQMSGELPCHVRVLAAPRQHTGLGTGTQLALAVAAGLHVFFQRPYRDAAELAQVVGRGLRSAIGTHGFERGGLLVEAGKLSGEAISPLLSRVELPQAWRFVLATPQLQSGLSGALEHAAFERLPPVPREVTASLCEEALLHLLPAAATADYGAFGRSLYRFGHQAGLCFAAAQHGAFATEPLRELAMKIRSYGMEGVGQSSWGPTLFAVTADEPQAQQLVTWLASQPGGNELELAIARPDCRGATITVDGVTMAK